MQPVTQELTSPVDLDALAEGFPNRAMTVYLRGGGGSVSDRLALLATEPFMTFSSRGRHCRIEGRQSVDIVGNPWSVLQDLIGRFQCELTGPSAGVPVGGCFGYWGYHLKDHVEPTLNPRLFNEQGPPDSLVGFYDSLVAQDRLSGKTWIICTGLSEDGTRTAAVAEKQLDMWNRRVAKARDAEGNRKDRAAGTASVPKFLASMTADQFVKAVHKARAYIQAGDIYQVNLSYQVECGCDDAWETFRELSMLSPAPYGAWMQAGDFQIASSSPEQFLRISGSKIRTRPIKGTRPRGIHAADDARLATELRASPKERAELIMITDLLRNDLGKVCEYGSVKVPELAMLEKYSHVQHLVATVEGNLRPGVSHLEALRACFPGGSVTGAPKFRAMQIIDELENSPRGIYTGALGYLGFNGESQLSIVIRTILIRDGRAVFNVGSGIVADSDPEAEYRETVDKGRGMIAALQAADRPQTEGTL